MKSDVLALNAGSSTLKYAAYRFEGGREQEVAQGTVRSGGGPVGATLGAALAAARSAFGSEPGVIGHRVVHGGPSFAAPVEVDDDVLARLRELTPLAPLHLPPSLELIEQSRALLPNARHVACFDTAFHRTLPEIAQRFALPDEWFERGVRRYGFHGLSYEYVVQSFGASLPRRLVVAHLGSGASLAAILEGRSIDTTMGLTPAGGVPMGTRSGDLDPGVVIHLLRQYGFSAASLEHLLDRESGLRGVGGTSDMSELVARAERGDPRAELAVELFSYAVKKQLGAYAAALGGLDCLVFTGGIGEHAPRVRELVVSGLESLGLSLEGARNRRNASVVSADGSGAEIRVLATREELVIARHAFALAAAP